MITTWWRRFLALDSAAGIVLALAALAALLISNSPLQGHYESVLRTVGEVRVGDFSLAKPVVVWVNDLWMAVFFFLVGLEIKREFVEGQLSTPAQALTPALAAVGGMALPAGLYALFTHADPVALRGWAIPSATDIAFALGVVLLLGSRVPTSLKVFLTAVAIIDDLGAIVVIALFYTADLSVGMLSGAAACGVVLALLHRARVGRLAAYVLVGGLMWLFVLKSGVHATLAGVATALAVPLTTRDGQRLAAHTEHALHPWVSFGVLPVFAFMNAGVSLQGVSWSTLVQPVPLGIVAGLVVGKTVGVFACLWGPVAAGWMPAPAGAHWRQGLGVSALCGIGFTMSLFIGGLAFEGLDPAWEAQVKLGVLGGSLVAGLLGTAILWRPPRGAA